jgi:putative nucleotidyltransferase with HDIG domain
MSEIFSRIMKDDIDIPGVPDMATKIMVVLEDKYCSVEKLEKVLIEDVSITSAILKIANAPAYRTGRSVKTIADALLTVGIDNLVPFICIAALANQHSKKKADKDINRHLMLVSAAASMLAKHVKALSVKHEIAAIAGLFHDVGKAVLFDNLPKEYANIKTRALKEKKPFFELEDELVGFNHTIIGSMLAKKWNLPPIYSECIKKHHDDKVKKSGLKEEDAICYLIRIADNMVLNMDGTPFISAEQHLPELMAAVGIDSAIHQKVAKKLKEEVNIDI